jgi:tetratricopeptide (TPR) repeat protein
MKYACVVLLCAIFWMSLSAENTDSEKGITKSQARSVVQHFYSALKGLPNVSNDEFYEYRDTNVYPYIIDGRAFNHPNDIQPLVSHLSSSESSKLINAYMGNIREYSKNNGLSIDYRICDIKDLREVVYENLKERLALTYWEITVDKTFNIDGKKYVLNDTVDVKISNGKIAFISNRMYREATPKPKMGDGKEIEAWHHELIARAARYWSQGRKKEAFDAYVKSVEDYDDPDTYFRIGVLLLRYHKECTNYSKRRARDSAYSYFCKAEKLGNSEATRVLDFFWRSSDPGPSI